MKYITVEDSVYQIPDNGYKKLEKFGERYLESLEYDDVMTLLKSLGAKLLGGVYMSFRF